MRNNLLLLVELNFMELFFNLLLISDQYHWDNSFLKECLSEFVVMMVAYNLLLRLHSWNKKCFCLFSIMFYIDISQFFNSIFISVTWGVWNVQYLYYLCTLSWNTFYHAGKNFFQIDVLDVLVPVPPDMHLACTTVDKDVTAWNNFLYVPSFHIIPTFSKNLSLGTNGGRAVKISLCCTISQFLRHNCCWDELGAKYGQRNWGENV